MARFHSTMTDSRGNEVSSVQHHSSTVIAEGWKGGIRVHLWHDGEVDRFEVWKQPPPLGGGRTGLLASGILDATLPVDHVAHTDLPLTYNGGV